ncbi:MAG: LptA/OstA family protein [Pseudomonadota bacterium]
MRWLATGLAATLACALPLAALAQGTQISLGNLAIAGDTPVEVAAEELSVNQEDGSAVFSGGVTVQQGDLTLTAAEVEIEYETADESPGGGIRRMVARGGVRLLNSGDAAESAEAVYDLEDGSLTMLGSVVLTQGQAVISGDRFAVDLETGTGQMQGNVRTVFQAQEN